MVGCVPFSVRAVAQRAIPFVQFGAVAVVDLGPLTSLGVGSRFRLFGGVRQWIWLLAPSSPGDRDGRNQNRRHENDSEWRSEGIRKRLRGACGFTVGHGGILCPGELHRN